MEKACAVSIGLRPGPAGPLMAPVMLQPFQACSWNWRPLMPDTSQSGVLRAFQVVRLPPAGLEKTAETEAGREGPLYGAAERVLDDDARAEGRPGRL